MAGLAVGGLLASLFMSNGIGSGILSWLLVGGLFLVLLSFIRNKRYQPNPVYKDDYRNQFAAENVNRNDRSYSSVSNVYPIGFDAATFLRNAKTQFIRLQAAYDQKNLNDIREFTTPEVFAEIQLQFQERGVLENITNVISLEAELLNVDQESQRISGADMQNMLAAVKFNGMIQEDRNDTGSRAKSMRGMTPHLYHYLVFNSNSSRMRKALIRATIATSQKALLATTIVISFHPCLHLPY